MPSRVPQLEFDRNTDQVEVDHKVIQNAIDQINAFDLTSTSRMLACALRLLTPHACSADAPAGLVSSRRLRGR
jgi:hypothetical protein